MKNNLIINNLYNLFNYLIKIKNILKLNINLIFYFIFLNQINYKI